MMVIKLNFDRIVFSLLCLYAFLIPFEHILEIYAGIETIFKPYRLAAILLIAVWALSRNLTKIQLGPDIKEDLFLYFIFVYGIIITLFRMIGSPFSTGPFYNDAFQASLYLAVFFIVKTLPVTREDWNKLLGFLVAGVTINAIYIFNNYYILKDFRRQSGFMDNPNFVALSLLTSISYLVIQLGNTRRFIYRVLIGSIILFSLYVFFISGSRTGLIILAVIGLFIFYYSSLRNKLIIAAGLICGLIFMVPKSIEEVEFGAPNLLLRRISQLDTSEDPRFPLWRGAIRASMESDFLGLGIGQFKARFPEFYRSENDDLVYRVVSYGMALSVHSDYLSILTNYGLPGLLSYLLFLFLSLKKIWLHLITAEDDYLRKIYQFNFIILISLAIFGIAAEDFNSPIYWLLLAVSTKTIQSNPSG